jgi:hypothetical protein
MDGGTGSSKKLSYFKLQLATCRAGLAQLQAEVFSGNSGISSDTRKESGAG